MVLRSGVQGLGLDAGWNLRKRDPLQHPLCFERKSEVSASKVGWSIEEYLS